jgi:hypothetical protein
VARIPCVCGGWGVGGKGCTCVRACARRLTCPLLPNVNKEISIPPRRRFWFRRLLWCAFGFNNGQRCRGAFAGVCLCSHRLAQPGPLVVRGGESTSDEDAAGELEDKEQVERACQASFRAAGTTGSSSSSGGSSSSEGAGQAASTGRASSRARRPPPGVAGASGVNYARQ